MDPRAGRPPARATARVLTAGALVASICLLAGFGLRAIGADEASARLVGNAGVLVLLATPAAGLLSTFVELREARPVVAVLALAVVAVLALAVVLAFATSR